MSSRALINLCPASSVRRSTHPSSKAMAAPRRCTRTRKPKPLRSGCRRWPSGAASSTGGRPASCACRHGGRERERVGRRRLRRRGREGGREGEWWGGGWREGGREGGMKHCPSPSVSLCIDPPIQRKIDGREGGRDQIPNSLSFSLCTYPFIHPSIHPSVHPSIHSEREIERMIVRGAALRTGDAARRVGLDPLQPPRALPHPVQLRLHGG
jgi:hypothetical protein